MLIKIFITFKESRDFYLSSIRIISLAGVSLLFLLLYLTVGDLSAATYYVSPTGNDNSTGLIGAPFKTIQKAASRVNPGDTVIVKDGTYTDVGDAPAPGARWLWNLP